MKDGFLTSRSVQSVAKFIEISIDMERTHKGIGGPDPGFDLMDHSVQDLEVLAYITGYLFNVILLGQRSISAP